MSIEEKIETAIRTCFAGPRNTREDKTQLPSKARVSVTPDSPEWRDLMEYDKATGNREGIEIPATSKTDYGRNWAFG